MRLDYFLIAFLVFTAFVIAGTMIMADMNASYNDVDMSTDKFSAVYNTTAEMYDISGGMYNHTLEGDISDTEPWESSVKGSYSAVRMVGQTFTLFGDIYDAIALELAIPSFFKTLAIAALTILIIFAVIYLFMRYKP